MEHIFYLDNDNKPSSRAQSAPGFKSRNASRPGTPGQVIYLPAMGLNLLSVRCSYRSYGNIYAVGVFGRIELALMNVCLNTNVYAI